VNTDYDYQALTAEAETRAKELVGRVLVGVQVNVIEPEFNFVHLETDAGGYAIRPEIGGEYVGVRKLDGPLNFESSDGSHLIPYAPFTRFIGKRIAEIHTIGKAWEGHGFEICFENMPNHSMLIMSMESAVTPEDYSDCLRLGIGEYDNAHET